MSAWSQVPLSEVIQVKHGFAFPGRDFSDDTSLPTLVTPGNFAIGGGFQQSKPKTFGGCVPSEYVLQPDDLLITMTDLSKQGDTLGLPALVPNDGRTYLHNQRIGLVQIIDPDAVNYRFLNYFLRTDNYRAHVLGTASGSTVKHTSPSRILSYRAGLPPFAEQGGIADVLGALDDKIAVNRRVARSANQIASLLYASATARVELLPMSEVLPPILGGTPQRGRDEYWNGDRPWASARDVAKAGNGLLLDTEQTISNLAVESTKAKPLVPGGVILTARGTVGAVARVGQPTSFNQSCYGFEPGALPAGVLYFAVLNAAANVHKLAHGSVFDTITMKSFDFLTVPNPSAFDVNAVERRLSPVLDLVGAKARESRTLASLRDTLLPGLMSGKLRVRDAERSVEAVV